MRRSLYLAVFPFALLLTTAQATPIPDPPQVAAKSYLLVDMNSNLVLAEHNADERIEPASLTKIMTAYSVFRELKEDHIKLTDEVRISKKAWQTEGSRMFVEVGKHATVEDLLKGLIIQSGNDAGIALAEHIAGSEQTFAELMNTHAANLRMHGSHFVNSTGLPHPDHYTTAHDMALVAEATIREFPEYYKWYSQKEFEFAGIKQHNRNKLLWRDNSVDGIKTGHTSTAGYCLVTSAKRDAMRLISVVIGSESEEARAVASQALLNYGFRFFEAHRLYPGDQQVDKVRVWKGDIEQLPVGPAQDVFVTIPRGQYQNLDAKMVINPEIIAPIAKGTPIGKIRISLNGEEKTSVPLVALQDVAAGGLFSQLIDSALMWFK